eukprot:4190613-Amphidinium_carterae.1
MTLGNDELHSSHPASMKLIGLLVEAVKFDKSPVHATFRTQSAEVFKADPTDDCTSELLGELVLSTTVILKLKRKVLLLQSELRDVVVVVVVVDVVVV